MSEYTKQGQNFLNKHNITFKTKFIEYGQHFEDDKEGRDIFKVTFSRPTLTGYRLSNKKQFSLRFGQSINESTGGGGNPPTAYAVLSCIQKYEIGTFEDFCGDFGYDTDSRNAEKIYKLVKKEWEKVNTFFTESEIEELQEIQ